MHCDPSEFWQYRLTFILPQILTSFTRKSHASHYKANVWEKSLGKSGSLLCLHLGFQVDIEVHVESAPGGSAFHFRRVWQCVQESSKVPGRSAFVIFEFPETCCTMSSWRKCWRIILMRILMRDCDICPEETWVTSWNKYCEEMQVTGLHCSLGAK